MSLTGAGGSWVGIGGCEADFDGSGSTGVDGNIGWDCTEMDAVPESSSATHKLADSTSLVCMVFSSSVVVPESPSDSGSDNRSRAKPLLVMREMNVPVLKLSRVISLSAGTLAAGS